MKKMLKEEMATREGDVARAGEVLEVIEKHTEIHKARNEQRALRVTEFNGTERVVRDAGAMGRQQKGTNKKHTQSRVL